MCKNKAECEALRLYLRVIPGTTGGLEPSPRRTEPLESWPAPVTMPGPTSVSHWK
jgi:hypothetical protein